MNNFTLSRRHFWLVALCCLLPVWGVLSMASQMGWPRYLEGADIRPYYTGGALVANGQGAQLYDLGAQWLCQKRYFPGLSTQSQLLPFIAPPFVAAPMAILAHFSVRTAFLIWLGVNWILLSVFTTFVIEELKPRGRKAQLVALVLCSTCAPVFVTLMQGQWAIVLALSSLFSWRALRLGRDFSGGMWLALWVFKPQLLLLPIAILLWKFRARALLGFATGAAFLGAVSLAIVGFGGLKTYLSLLREASSWQLKYGVNAKAMFTWSGLLANFDAHFLWWPGVLIFVAVLFASWRGAWKKSENQSSTRWAENENSASSVETSSFNLRWAMTLIAALFCSPYLYYHDLTLLLVPLLLAAQASQNARHNKWLDALPVFGYVMLWLEFLSNTIIGKVALNVLFMALSFAVLAVFAATERRENEHLTIFKARKMRP